MKLSLLREEWRVCALLALGLVMIPTGILPVQVLGLGLTSPFGLLMGKMYFTHKQAERTMAQMPSYAQLIGSTICRAFDLNFCNKINVAVPRLQLTTDKKYYSSGDGRVILVNLPISVGTVVPGNPPTARNLLPTVESQLDSHWIDQWGPVNVGMVLDSVDIKYLHNQQMFLLELKICV